MSLLGCEYHSCSCDMAMGFGAVDQSQEIRASGGLGMINDAVAVCRLSTTEIQAKTA